MMIDSNFVGLRYILIDFEGKINTLVGELIIRKIKHSFKSFGRFCCKRSL